MLLPFSIKLLCSALLCAGATLTLIGAPITGALLGALAFLVLWAWVTK